MMDPERPPDVPGNRCVRIAFPTVGGVEWATEATRRIPGIPKTASRGPHPKVRAPAAMYA
ncbi:hypothetical protein GCM10027160_05570 [Streptomyces calidiresistens]